MGPFYGMVKHALRMRKAMSSSPGGGIPWPYGSCQFALYGQPGSRDELLALAALCLRTFKQCGKGDKAGGKQADSLAWMRKRCSLPAGLPDSFGIALQVWYCCSIALLPCWMFQRADPEGKERETCWWPWCSRHKEILVCSDGLGIVDV